MLSGAPIGIINPYSAGNNIKCTVKPAVKFLSIKEACFL